LKEGIIGVELMQVIKKLSTGEGVAILNNSGIISLWAKGDN